MKIERILFIMIIFFPVFLQTSFAKDESKPSSELKRYSLELGFTIWSDPNPSSLSEHIKFSYTLPYDNNQWQPFFFYEFSQFTPQSSSLPIQLHSLFLGTNYYTDVDYGDHSWNPYLNFGLGGIATSSGGFYPGFILGFGIDYMINRHFGIGFANKLLAASSFSGSSGMDWFRPELNLKVAF